MYDQKVCFLLHVSQITEMFVHVDNPGYFFAASKLNFSKFLQSECGIAIPDFPRPKMTYSIVQPIIPQKPQVLGCGSISFNTRCSPIWLRIRFLRKNFPQCADIRLFPSRHRRLLNLELIAYLVHSHCNKDF